MGAGKLSASAMTDAAIAAELASLGKQWDEFVASDDEGHGGSPGEWMVERMGELETEQKRRRAALQAHRASAAGKEPIDNG